MLLKKAPDGPKHGGERSAVQTGNTCSAKRDPRQGFPVLFKSLPVNKKKVDSAATDEEPPLDS